MALLKKIETFLNQHGMAPTRFGRDAVRDPKFVFDLRRGREPTGRMTRRVEHFMNAYGAEQSR